jgi:hypothetical protein
MMKGMTEWSLLLVLSGVSDLPRGLMKGEAHGKDLEKDIKQKALVFRFCFLRDG